jgi:hypothetical protein
MRQESNRNSSFSRVETAAALLNGALYAAFGYLTYLGIFAPIFGVVRFWPAVIVPGAFAAIFGPKVGGVGAAIGIFISDILIHGNPILSLTVGVTSNFVGFYLVGHFARKTVSVTSTLLFLFSGLGLAAIAIYLYQANLLEAEIFWLFLAIDLASLLVVGIMNFLWPKWGSYWIGAVVGLVTGSLIIGFGLWGYSQFLVLPLGMGSKVPLSAALVWLIWTYSTEIPFLIVVVPPILSAAFKAFPSLQPKYLKRETSMSRKT